MRTRDRERGAYIYTERKKGRTYKSIASEFGISTSRVRYIYCAEDWERNGPECDAWQLHFKKHPEDREPWTTRYYEKHSKEKPEG